VRLAVAFGSPELERVLRPEESLGMNAAHGLSSSKPPNRAGNHTDFGRRRLLSQQPCSAGIVDMNNATESATKGK